MKKIPFFMVTGFLGSGKTTLLKNLLDRYAGSKKIGIVQNEFAPSGIDGIDLKRSDLPFSLLEINNGSVFCVCLLGDFIKSLTAFVQEKDPDLIILESSGLSDPVSIAQLFQAPPLCNLLYLAHIWCVIDSLNFHRTAVAETQIIHQIRVADTIILNKTDLGIAYHGQIRSKISSWNPYAEIIPARFCNINPELPLVTALRPKEDGPYESCVRPDNIQTSVLKTGKRISPENFDLFLETEPMRSSYRIKGYVNLTGGKTWAVQTSFGLVSKTEIEGYGNNTEMIIMGPMVNAGEIHRKVKALASATVQFDNMKGPPLA